jgi:hypothetical protein
VIQAILESPNHAKAFATHQNFGPAISEAAEARIEIERLDNDYGNSDKTGQSLQYERLFSKWRNTPGQSLPHRIRLYDDRKTKSYGKLNQSRTIYSSRNRI